MGFTEYRNYGCNTISLESAKLLFYRSMRQENAGKKSLTSSPHFVAIRMAATLFQLVIDTVL